MKWVEGVIELLTLPSVTGLYPITCRVYVSDVAVLVVAVVLNNLCNLQLYHQHVHKRFKVVIAKCYH